MIITAIKAQVKRPERISIFVDGAYSFSLSQTQLLDEKLRVGLEIDKERLADLQRVSDFGKAYERVLNYIMIRPRSIREVQDYCRRKQIDMTDCQRIIDKLAKFGYINDKQFAKAWVESRRLTKAMSERALKMELKRKGITDAIISEVLTPESYSNDDALRKLIEKKQKLSRYRADPQKLMQYLARQGFGYDDIKTAMAENAD